MRKMTLDLWIFLFGFHQCFFLFWIMETNDFLNKDAKQNQFDEK